MSALCSGHAFSDGAAPPPCAAPPRLRHRPAHGNLHGHVQCRWANLRRVRRGGIHDRIWLRQRGAARMEEERPQQVRQIRLQRARTADPRLGRHRVPKKKTPRPSQVPVSFLCVRALCPVQVRGLVYVLFTLSRLKDVKNRGKTEKMHPSGITLLTL